MSSHPPRVIVLIETSTSWGKDAVKGIVDYIRGANRWILSIDWSGVHEQLRLPHNWRGEGIIARVTSETLARQIESLHIPAVNVSWSTVPNSKVPQLTTDQRAIGRLAAEHFLERGYRNFAYVGTSELPNYIDHCGPTFTEHALLGGGQFWQFHAQKRKGATQSRWAQIAALERWLKKLPRPVAVFAWDPVRGLLVTEACRNAGLRVPEDVSVLAGFNDELMCEISTPPLSAVEDSAYRTGHAAARLLDQLMHGATTPKEPLYLPPTGVIVRRSTDTLAHQDLDMAAAISYIREHAFKPIHVRDVLKKVPVSRRVLEQRFLQELGRSPAAEIRRLRLQRAQELLTKTDLPIAKVATTSGFLHPEVMTRAFRREIGVSPLSYRRQFRFH